MKKVILVLASVLAIESCTSTSYRGSARGMWTGAAIGGAIGGLMGGHRGHDFGTVIGVIAGAAAGAIAAEAAEDAERRRYDEYVRDYDRSSHRSNRSAHILDGKNYNHGSAIVEKVYSPLTIRNLRFIDDGGNQIVNRGEDCKIIFELCNNTDETLYDVVPFVNEINGNSHVFLSPSTRIEVVKPGDVVRYTCSLRADKKLSAGKLDFRISVSYSDNDFVTLKEFSLQSAK